MFDFGDSEVELGTRVPPARYAFTCELPVRPQKPKQKGTKPKARPRRGGTRGAAPDLDSLDSEERAFLEANAGVSPACLPPHLQCYALQRRNAASFSGPGVLPGEQEAGRVEYKLRLLDPTPDRFQQLVTQLNWRLSEGGGECLYCLGVEDNGHPRGLERVELAASLAVLVDMAAEVGAAAEVLQTPPGSADSRQCAVVRVTRPTASAPDYTDLRVAVAGGVDSGKSTLVGVLSHGAGGAPALDNGRGSSRMQVFRHKHEIESGHTSSISLQQLAYDAEGNVLNYGHVAGLGPAELAACASRVLRFFDLGGHERFSKTALHGLTCMLPDYAMLCVNAVTGVSWVTREHLAVGIALGIPVFIALTKCDVASEAAVQAAVAEIRSLLAAAVERCGGAVPHPEALAPLVHTDKQAEQLAARMHRSRVASPGASLCVPLFPTSAVTGASLRLLHRFLHSLQPAVGADAAPRAGHEGMQGWRQGLNASSSPAADALDSSRLHGRQPAHFQIDGSFEVADVGTVYSGTVVSGSLKVGEELLLGPLEGSTFKRVVVSGIHRSKVAVQSAQQGQHATVAVQAVEAREQGGGTGASCSARTASQALDAPDTGGSERRLTAEEPARTDSAGCLHAWMTQQASSSPAAQLTCTSAAVAISAGPTSLAGSRSAAQLDGWQEGRGLLASSAEPLHSWRSSPSLLSAGSMPAPRPRKGAVLLHPSLQPAACTEFEAVLVLLGGHWPARGLLSGRYPPEGEHDEPDPSLPSPRRACHALSLGASAASDSGDGGLLARSLGSGKRTRRRGGSALSYIPVVHCGSIRQAAQVASMRELPWSRGRGGGGCEDSARSSSSGGGGDGSAGEGCLGSGAASGELSLGLDCLAELVGGGGAGTDAAEALWREEDDEDPLSALLGCDLLSEPSGISTAAATFAAAGGSDAGASAAHLDACRLAGAVAAAGVLLPQALMPGAGSFTASSAGASASSGHGSSGEAGGGNAAGVAGGSPCVPPRELSRRGSLLAYQDVGCIAAVKFRFMHHPEWLVEGARLIVRDRTTGRTSGAGYVASIQL